VLERRRRQLSHWIRRVLGAQCAAVAACLPFIGGTGIKTTVALRRCREVSLNRPGLRVLLTEGSSTSAREAVTTLGLGGFSVEVCDTSALCFSRFSRFVGATHRCPSVSTNPAAYLDFILKLLATGRYDVLLPIHEQGFVFARFPERIPAGVGVALPSFNAYWTILNKARFSRLLTELDLPQPRTQVVLDVDAIEKRTDFPVVIKLPISTASRGVTIVRTRAELDTARRKIGPGEVVVQDFVEGPLEHVQAVFDRSRLVAMHGYRQVAGGAGGGESVKESVYRPAVREAVERIASRLEWHGAISFDYILSGYIPLFIDSNPRLVEPMSAYLAGTDLTGLLISISLGEHPTQAIPGVVGLRTRLAMQAVLGAALRTRSRRAVLKEIIALARLSGIYDGTQEELTPVRQDLLSLLPLAATVSMMLFKPELAETLNVSGWGAGLLTPDAVDKVAAGLPTEYTSEP
jgi:predicted ATP-grasp superfamily ATP-dependent carboligase